MKTLLIYAWKKRAIKIGPQNSGVLAILESANIIDIGGAAVVHEILYLEVCVTASVKSTALQNCTGKKETYLDKQNHTKS